MPQNEPIRVECYAARKGDERPYRIHWGDRTIAVDGILERAVESGVDPRTPLVEKFLVVGDDERLYTLRHDCSDDRWWIEVR